jgi:hypothetical protein
MKIKIAVRVYNEEYFIGHFLNYYLNLGVDEIHIFDCESNDSTIEDIEAIQNRHNEIILVESNKKFRHFNHLNQTRFCNHMLKYSIQKYLEDYSYSWWLFLDVDEFIRIKKSNLKNFFKKLSGYLLRSIFLEWYWPPEMEHAHFNFNKILNLVHNGNLKGKILNLWGDPFYKDQIISINENNLNLVRKLKTTSRFHRWILNQNIIYPQNRNIILVDHLRGIPISVAKSRINQNLELMKNEKDDWGYIHFKQLKRNFEKYQEFYENLDKIEIINEVLRKVEKYDNSESIYNNTILKDEIEDLGCSKPSHFNMI